MFQEDHHEATPRLSPRIDERAPRATPTAESLAIDRHTAGAGIAVLVVGGEVDMLTVSVLGQRARSELLRHHHLVLDLDRLAFLGAAGLRALVELHQLAPGRVHIAGSTRTTRRLFELTGLDRLVCLHPDAAEAVTALYGTAKD
jgi:anti-sigma B factor antagonist